MPIRRPIPGNRRLLAAACLAALAGWLLIEAQYMKTGAAHEMPAPVHQQGPLIMKNFLDMMADGLH